jgi:hypothetical protein
LGVIVPRPLRSSDLYRLRIPTEPRLSPDGRLAIVALTTSAPRHDGWFRHYLVDGKRGLPPLPRIHGGR